MGPTGEEKRQQERGETMKRGKGGGGVAGGGARNGLLPNSLRIISSCLKTVSSNAGSVASTVRSAGASVAASIAAPPEDEKDQVIMARFFLNLNFSVHERKLTQLMVVLILIILALWLPI